MDEKERDEFRGDLEFEMRYGNRSDFMEFCRLVFNQRNLIGTDFEDVQVFQVTGRDFEQQANGGGVHVSFSVSWHALGKVNGVSKQVTKLLPELAEEEG